MDFYELVSKAVGDLRKRQGLTPDALAKQSVLLPLLDTDDEYEAFERLQALAYKLGDDQDAKMLRAALAIGVDRLKNATARRTAARENGTFYGSVRAGFDAEDRAIKRLVKLLFKESSQANPAEDSAQAGPLEEEASHQPTNLDGFESAAEPQRWLKRRHLVLSAAACVAAGVLLAPAAWKGRSDDREKDSSYTEPTVELPNLDNTAGWGPQDRKMYSVKSPAPYAVFNSLTDQYTQGDERQFLQCRDNESDHWSTRIAAEDGHVYICYAWFSNAVAPNLDEGNLAAKLQNARFRIGAPEVMPAYNAGLTAKFMADNAFKVWASCNFVAEWPMTITYMPRSTFLITKHTEKKYGDKGMPMPDKWKDGEIVEGITTKQGALIGESKQDGIIGQTTGWVRFAIKIKFAKGIEFTDNAG
ncbi:hypothetical protein [Streptomyces ossamyceticus]|uniref:hypothetical protein n=1 Tax=Streptomyces ossamyceticus TaxID=249581 RepID=UPI0006E2E809|nr:hypothetical protein [Streptomyces ossamyceticus]